MLNVPVVGAALVVTPNAKVDFGAVELVELVQIHQSSATSTEPVVFEVTLLVVAAAPK